jgi:hypothetical protein
MQITTTDNKYALLNTLITLPQLSKGVLVPLKSQQLSVLTITEPKDSVNPNARKATQKTRRK